MAISEQSSFAFWQVKAFAIFTVFFAHMPGHAYDGSSVIWQEVFDVIGMLGVPLFFMISGYFDKISHSPIILRLKNLLIPLLIWGSITFFLHVLKTPSSNMCLDYFYWIYGCNNYLYFVPVLIWCIVLSRLCNEWILVGLGLLSQILSFCNIIPYNQVFTQYVNPLNFIIYFAVGRLIREFFDIERTNPQCVVISALVVILFLSFPDLKPRYCSPFTILFTTSLFYLSYCFFFQIEIPLMAQLGKFSYVLYLSHIQIAGFVHFSLQSIWGTWIEPIKVFIAFIIRG